MMNNIAWQFPGQGAQFVSMGQDLVAAYPEAARTFEEADRLLGVSLSELCFRGPAEVLTDTVNAQPAIYTHSAAVLHILHRRRPDWQPDFVVGHSMGEYSALYAAGALTFADGLRLVRERGRLMKLAGERQPGGMAAILGLDIPTVEAICQQAREESGRPVQVANDNCPGQVVISGAVEALERAVALAEEAGARRVVRLAISIAAHSPLMGVITEEFAAAVRATPMQPPRVPIVMNATATPTADLAEIREHLIAQLTSPVRWTESIRRLQAEEVTELVEIGPGDVLTKLARRIDRDLRRLTLGTAEQLAAFLGSDGS